MGFFRTGATCSRGQRRAVKKTGTLSSNLGDFLLVKLRKVFFQVSLLSQSHLCFKQPPALNEFLWKVQVLVAAEILFVGHQGYGLCFAR